MNQPTHETKHARIRATQDCERCRNFAWSLRDMEPTLHQGSGTWHHPSCPCVRAPSPSLTGTIIGGQVAANRRRARF